MFFIFVFLWLIAVFILANEKSVETDKWIALTLFIYGLGGLAEVLRLESLEGKISWIYPAILTSIDMLWGPVALLIFALYFVGLVPKEKIKKLLVFMLIIFPVLLFYLLVPEIRFFGGKESHEASIVYYRIMTLLVAPHYIGSFGLLTWHLFDSNNNKRLSAVLPTYILAVPTSLTYYIFIYILPSFSVDNGWIICLIIMALIVILFMVFLVKYGIFGLTLFPDSPIAENKELMILNQKHELYQHLSTQLDEIKRILIKILDKNSPMTDSQETIDKLITRATEISEATSRDLTKVNKLMNPIQLEKKECTIKQIIDDATNKSFEEQLSEQDFTTLQLTKTFHANPIVHCDKEQLVLAMTYLLRNVIESFQDGEPGKLYITVEMKRNKAMIYIQDNGHNHEKDQSSFGLSSFFIKKIMYMHGGKLISNHLQGLGRKITLILPAINA
jgi:hypothetical protein